MMLSEIALITFATAQSANLPGKSEQWPGVTVKVLVDNDKVNVSEVTFEPGAVADWHSHPQHTVYAVNDVSMRVEVEGKQASTALLKPGQAIWSPAVRHKTTNTGKASFTIIVTEIK